MLKSTKLKESHKKWQIFTRSSLKNYLSDCTSTINWKLAEKKCDLLSSKLFVLHYRVRLFHACTHQNSAHKQRTPLQLYILTYHRNGGWWVKFSLVHTHKNFYPPILKSKLGSSFPCYLSLLPLHFPPDFFSALPFPFLYHLSSSLSFLSPPLPFSPSLRIPFPFLLRGPTPLLPLVQLKVCGSAVTPPPQWNQTEPGHQTVCSAFWANNSASGDKQFCIHP